MLLIGSRATLIHFPDFRAPKDWDLIATPAEIDTLREVLEPLELRGGSPKATFLYDGAMLEVENTATSEYWAQVYEAFANEPCCNLPQLGRVRVAPAAYLLLIKQCGLVYPTAHWHKNLEDLYFLRDRIPVISDEIAALLPPSVANSVRLFTETHERHVIPMTCHPGSRSVYNADTHRALHERLALSGEPCVDRPGAWQSFPELPKEQRQGQMRLLLAEEAMVLASERLREQGQGVGAVSEAELTTWALRMLSTGSLPISWRYFAINHYREIRGLIPDGWMQRLGELADSRGDYPSPCAEVLGCTPASAQELSRSATGSQSVPAVIGDGLPCGVAPACQPLRTG